MTVPDIGRQTSEGRWLPASAGVAVIVLVTGAVVAPQLMADAAATSAAASPQAGTDTMSNVAGAPRVCKAPPPMTLRQLAALARKPVLPPARLSTASPARPHLRPLIRDLSETPCDAATGRFAHTQVRQWATNTSSSGGVTTLDVEVWQYQRWAAEDNSGRTVTLTQPAQDRARTDDSYRPVSCWCVSCGCRPTPAY